ncbi:hypothetical protein HDU96_010466 [Phlyctochytrium bullatum]|nr:hypothetical protein HDU96_010466 [Phlyctochytrium bullatum]
MAFDHAWLGYSTFAMGSDELRPVSKQGNSWLHLGLTIFDLLDTALIMNRTDIFEKAVAWIEKDFRMTANVNANVFETTIRVLGGLLSAYHLIDNAPGVTPAWLKEKKAVLRNRAVEVAEKLLPAFDTDSGLPLTSIHLSSGRAVGGPYDVSLSEATSVQLEFKYLSHVTGDAKYWNAVEKVMTHIDKLEKLEGLAPIYLYSHNGRFKGSEIRLGSHGDSYYEYLGKQYLLTNGTEKGHLRQYTEAATGIKKHLLSRSTPHNLLYVQELPSGPGGTPLSKMDHLVCYLPGTMALLATQGKRVATPEARMQLTVSQQVDLHVAEEIMRACYEMYHQTVTGLAPEIVFFRGNGDAQAWLEEVRKNVTEAKKAGVAYEPTSIAQECPDGKLEEDFEIHRYDGHNLLRPEVVESLFVLNRITGKEVYREWGWKIFQAFEKYSKVESGGYSCLDDIRKIPPEPRDQMESFFLGETLKYLYLLFTEDDGSALSIPLERYVFNTEAHPLPVFEPAPGIKSKLVLLSD